VDEMSAALQVKILRVIQWGEYAPVGSEKTRNCDVRIVATAKSDLKKLVKEGKFREDLFYRLNMFRIIMPALKERPEDILLLAKYFLQNVCKKLNKKEPKFSAAAKRIIQTYPFPGNVRELENIIQRAVILCRGDTIKVEHLPEEIQTWFSGTSSNTDLHSLPFKEAKERIVSNFEQNYLRKVLDRNNGIISKAAESAGMHKKNFHEKLVKYGIRSNRLKAE
jgi:DNA-binding NtrC family response regulator